MSECSFCFKIEIVNDSIVQPAPNEIAKDCPVQTVDESVSYDFSKDVHPERLKTNSDNEKGIPNVSLPQSPTSRVVGESFQPNKDIQTSTSSASSASPPLSRKSILTIVLDLNGLLLKRCEQQPSSVFESIQIDSKRYVVLRPGCIQFLKILLEKYNVGIWSTAKESNVLSILRVLQDKAGEILPFFVVWSQEACEMGEHYKLARPDNPSIQAMFKPVSKISTCFDCDARRTILIDDSPYKGCASPDNNCIYPTKFDEEKLVDNVLIHELLPYLLQLDESNDVREVIGSNRYGQPPVSHEKEYKGVVDFWKERNLKWSKKMIYTDRLPLAESLQKLVDSQKVLERDYKKKREQIREIMAKERVNVASMRGPQLISLARKLGSTTTHLRGNNARAFINKVLKEYNLLQLG